MICTIKKNKNKLQGCITLPSSKSISNRILIIKELCPVEFKIHNISSSDDTVVLIKSIKNINNPVFDVGAAGTAMRFLTAYFSLLKGERIITGSERMKQRPIGELVNILRDFGAQIEYIEKDGFPPLKISGNNLKAKDITIRGDISSQFISALLLIAPYLDGHFSLTIDTKIISKEYIWMTIKLMEIYGIDIVWNNQTIHVKKGQYTPVDTHIESDWSSASYWFEIVSLSNNAIVELIGLQEESLQGDSVLPKLFQKLGVETVFTNSGIKLSSQPADCSLFEFDFSNNPDLAQTLVVTLVAKHIPFKINGLDNLSIKETDRIHALIKEFKELGISLLEEPNFGLSWQGNEKMIIPENHIVETYDDHRMALAFAPLALVYKSIAIQNPGVTTKSYPGFWGDLKEVGFDVEIYS